MMRPRCTRLLAFVLLVVVCVGGSMFAGLTRSAQATPPAPIRWLLAGPGIAAIAADPDASRLLDKTQPFVAMGRNTALPSGWNAVPYVSFKSVAAIEAALEGGQLGPQVQGIMYDNERWPFTPVAEQRNPARYEKVAADLGHRNGLLFLAAPAVDLVGVLAPNRGGNRYEIYLALGIAADAARYADIFDIQAQGAERDTRLYANFVREAAAQARQSNPKVLVLAGVSTNPNGQRVTAADILRAVAATRDIVDGYWLNIPRPGIHCPRCNDFRPDIAIEVLRRLAAS
jgi:hypothetical protein